MQRGTTYAILTAATLTTLPACDHDSVAIVAKVVRHTPRSPDAGSATDASVTPGGDGGVGGAGTASDGGSSLPDAGPPSHWPTGMSWSLYAEPSGSAEWVTPPTATSVSVAARAPQNVRAGLAFEFADGALLDLAAYDEVELSMTVSEGENIELFLGRGPDVGCSYVFSKALGNVYRTSLSSPAWCVPTQCGFDLKVNGGMVLAHVPTDSRLTATVTGLHFIASSDGVRSGSASALGGAKGPGGFCWFLVDWERTANVNWLLTNPTSSSVHVLASTSKTSLVGMAFEIPQGFRMSQYRSLLVDATVSGGSGQGSLTFLVQAVKLGQGRGWVLQGDGRRQTYRIDLTQPGYSFNSAGGSGQLGLDDVARIEFVPQTNGGQVTMDALVQSLEFQP